MRPSTVIPANVASTKNKRWITPKQTSRSARAPNIRANQHLLLLPLAVAAESMSVDASFQEQTNFETSQIDETSTPPAGTLGACNCTQAHSVPTNNAQQPAQTSRLHVQS